MTRLPKTAAIICICGIITVSLPFVGLAGGQAEKPVDADLNRYLNNIEMVSVPGECFQMGSLNGSPDEKPVHEVCLDNYKIGKYEVTQELWQAVMRTNPSHFQESPSHPVEMVTWEDTQEFIDKLNTITGKNYRLPTEAEWEYACLSGGKDEKFCGSNVAPEVAWYDNQGGKTTKAVGTKQPNSLGIYDMSGNVEEWVSDWFDPNYYASSPKENPTGPSVAPEQNYGHVIRGGEWNCGDTVLRARNRHTGGKNDRLDKDLGFRLAH